MHDRPHWSYSAISQYLRCPLQFYFQRVLGLPVKSVSSGLILGGAIHEALAEYHRSLQRQELTLPKPITETFQAAWGNREAKEEIIYRDGDNREECIDKGIHLLEIYLQEPPPQGIIGVEEKFLVPLYNSHGEYLEKPLLAVTDLITQSEKLVLTVREFKTSGRAFSESEVQTSLQPTCYVHAVHERYRQESRVEYVVLVKTKTPKVQRISTARYSSDFGRLGDMVQTVERAVDLGVFYPVETPMNCSTCAFREHCREWGQKKRATEVPLPSEEKSEELACSPS